MLFFSLCCCNFCSRIPLTTPKSPWESPFHCLRNIIRAWVRIRIFRTRHFTSRQQLEEYSHALNLISTCPKFFVVNHVTSQVLSTIEKFAGSIILKWTHLGSTLSSDLKSFLIGIIRFYFLNALFYDWKTFLNSERTFLAFTSLKSHYGSCFSSTFIFFLLCNRGRLATSRHRGEAADRERRNLTNDFFESLQQREIEGGPQIEGLM